MEQFIEPHEYQNEIDQLTYEAENVGISKGYIVIPRWLLCDKNLNSNEKLVYARITGFEVYYESSNHCAEFMGLSPRVVQETKCSLEKKGYIQCVKNNGRGKSYIAVDVENPDIRKNVVSTTQTRGSQPRKHVNIYKRENKEDNKNNIKSINTLNRAKSSENTCITNKNFDIETSKQTETLNIETNIQTEENFNSIKPKELNSKKHREPNEWGGYGKPEIDHLFYEWENSVKTPLTGTKQQNRNTAQRLLKKYSEEDLIGAIKIVAITKQSEDRYIPVINSLMDLENKFGSLVHWYQKNKQAYEEQQRIKQATEGDTLSEEDLLAYMEMMKDEQNNL